MKKSVCSLILFTLLISESCFSEINSDYGKIYQFPSSKTTFLSDKISLLDNGLLSKTGLKFSYIPFVEIYASNGLSFTKWELPFDVNINDCFYPMVTACGTELCLFLNNRLEFFLPDGEYLRSQILTPPIVPDFSRKIVDMNFNKLKNQFHFLVKNEDQPFFSWYVYSTNGVLLNSDKWSETSTTNSAFLTFIENKTFFGTFINNSLSLFHSDGTSVLDSPIYETLNKIHKSLNLLFGEKANLSFSDVEVGDQNIWIQCNKGLFCFDFNGKLLHAPLSFDEEINNNLSGRLNDDTFFCQVNDTDFATFHASGVQAGRCFFRKYYKDCDKLISITQDSSNNWWTVYQNFSEGSTQSFLLNQSEEGTELNKWIINNDEIPTVFACNYQNPIALVGKKNVYPLSYFEFLQEEKFLPWSHNIISNFNDKIVAAADKNNLIYLLNSTAESNVRVFTSTGRFVRTFDVAASFLFPSKSGSVSALFLKPKFRFYLQNLYEDGSISSSYQIKNNEKWNEIPLSIVQLESGVIVIGLKNEIVFCAPVQKNKILLSNGLEIKILPRGAPVAVDYKPDLNLLSLYSFDWQKKSSRNLYKKLSHYGKKLSKNSKTRKKLFKKIFNYINKEKSKINLVLKNTGKTLNSININAYTGIKSIKTFNVNLESVIAKTGEKPVSLGKLSFSKNSNCKVECARLKKLNVKGDFSGNITAWFGDINSINIKGEIINASFLSRKNIKKLTSNKNISHSVVRAGISPLGFSGFSGNIISVKSNNNIENCQFIACADEGNISSWNNDSLERFNGSIMSVRTKIVKTTNKFLPIGEVRDSLFVSKNPINLLVQKKEGNSIIINGKKQK